MNCFSMGTGFCENREYWCLEPLLKVKTTNVLVALLAEDEVIYTSFYFHLRLFMLIVFDDSGFATFDELGKRK